jgi:hypothetical protein
MANVATWGFNSSSTQIGLINPQQPMVDSDATSIEQLLDMANVTTWGFSTSLNTPQHGVPLLPDLSAVPPINLEQPITGTGEPPTAKESHQNVPQSYIGTSRPSLNPSMDFFNFSQEGEAHYSERVTPSTQEDWISV